MPQMTPRQIANMQRIFAMPFGSLYPALVAKVEKKGRTREELDEVTCWLTGHDPKSLAKALADGISTEDFVSTAPKLNPKRELVTGVVCGVRVEEVEDPTMRVLRQLDKLVDELAMGRPMEKVLR